MATTGGPHIRFLKFVSGWLPTLKTTISRHYLGPDILVHRHSSYTHTLTCVDSDAYITFVSGYFSTVSYSFIRSLAFPSCNVLPNFCFFLSCKSMCASFLFLFINHTFHLIKLCPLRIVRRIFTVDANKGFSSLHVRSRIRS